MTDAPAPHEDDGPTRARCVRGRCSAAVAAARAVHELGAGVVSPEAVAIGGAAPDVGAGRAC